MFNFLKNLFRPKNTEGPHPLDGPIRAAQEKAALPNPPEPPAPPPIVTPAPTPVVELVAQPVVPPEPIANNTHILFPKTPEPTPAPVQAKKPRKPRAPKTVAMSTQLKKKK